MTKNVKDPRLAEVDRTFKINYPDYQDIPLTSLKEVDGFYVALFGREEFNRALYFILPKDNKQSKGAVINMESHPEYEGYAGICFAKTYMELYVEGKSVVGVYEYGYTDVRNMLSVRRFLRKHKKGRDIIKFLDKFIIDKEDLRQKRREELKDKASAIKNGFEEMLGSGVGAIKNKIEHLKNECRDIYDSATKEAEQAAEQARENKKVKKTINYYTKRGGRDK